MRRVIIYHSKDAGAYPVGRTPVSYTHLAAGITAGAQLYWVALLGTAVIAVLYILITIFRKEKKSYLLIVRYDASCEMNVNGVLGAVKYRLKNKMCIRDRFNMVVSLYVLPESAFGYSSSAHNCQQ